MADTTKSTNQLKLVAGFTDGDDRTISLENPRDNITAANISAIDSLAAGILLGDKAGAEFMRWKSAKTVETTTVYLDLTPNA